MNNFFFNSLGKNYFLFLIIFSSYTLPAFSESGVSVFMYHRFGEDKYPSTNVSEEQFFSHIDYILSNEIKVIKLEKLIEDLDRNKKFNDKTVAFSVDDAYSSFYKIAWPIFRDREIPVTLFVSTEIIDDRTSGYMTWEEIKTFVDEGGSIGQHTSSHLHMPLNSISAIKEDILNSHKSWIKNIGYIPKLFAYPYGEYDNKTIEIVKGSGFEAAFGQHSGVAHLSAGIFELPRFAMNENYGDLERLKLATNALPIIIKDISPENNFLKKNPPDFGFTLSSEIKPMKAVRCFASNGIVTNTKRIGKFRIEVRLEEKFPNIRGRINCTMAANDGRWRWFGKQFVTN